MVPSKRFSSDLSEKYLFQILKNILLFIKIKAFFFFKLLPKFGDLIISDDCIDSVTEKKKSLYSKKDLI